MPGYRSRLIALALAVCTALVPSLAASSAEAGGGISLPDSFRRTPSDGNFQRELALMAAGHGDPAEHAFRAMVHAGRALAGLPPLADEEGCVYQELEAVSPGDLTGDGFDDALEYSFLLDFCEFTITSSATALSGATGEELWHSSFGDLGVLIPAGDLDGVAGADLIEYSIVAQLAPGLFDWTISYSGVSGKTGSELWTRSYRDPWTEAYVGPTAAFAELDYAVPFGLADATGDGSLDLLVGRFNSALAYDGATEIGGGGSVALFEVLSGADGVPAAEIPATGQGAYPTAALIPDTNGDGAADVATASVELEDDGHFTVDVSGYSGKGGPPLWSHSTEMASPPYAQGAELDGDGKGDVLLTAIDWEGFGLNAATNIVAVYGTSLTTTRSWFLGTSGLVFPEPVPNVKGVGTQDLMLVGLNEDWSMTALLVDGNEPLESAWGVSGEYVELVGDATGDGLEDVLVYDYYQDPVTNDWIDTTELVTGSTGHAVWTRVVPEGDGYSFVYAVGADGNFNGTSDIALISNAGDSDEYTLLEGSTGTSLWNKARRVGGYLYYLNPGLLEGAGDDLLEAVETDGGSFKVAARRGENGAVIWKR